MHAYVLPSCLCICLRVFSCLRSSVFVLMPVRVCVHARTQVCINFSLCVRACLCADIYTYWRRRWRWPKRAPRSAVSHHHVQLLQPLLPAHVEEFSRIDHGWTGSFHTLTRLTNAPEVFVCLYQGHCTTMCSSPLPVHVFVFVCVWVFDVDFCLFLFLFLGVDFF